MAEGWLVSRLRQEMLIRRVVPEEQGAGSFYLRVSPELVKSRFAPSVPASPSSFRRVPVSSLLPVGNIVQCIVRARWTRVKVNNVEE
jgi:hypothetical protein